MTLLLRSLGLPALLVLLVAGDKDAESDTVFLTNGKSLEGRLVYEDDEVLILRKGSKDKEVDQAEVKEVDARTRHLDELLDRLEGLGPDGLQDANAVLELARFAESTRLSGEAHMLYLRTLLSDPEHEAALDVLGCRKRKGHWSYKHEGKWYRTAELNTAVEDWKDRWTLETVHYKLQTNIPLSQAIAAIMDLERFCRAFYDLFKLELRLLEPDETMAVSIHADDGSFPEKAAGRSAYFLAADDRVVHLNASVRPWRHKLFREATHQILFTTAERSKDGRGRIPRWLDEGLAEALSTGLGGELGNSTFDLSSIEAPYFHAHARAPEPYDFSRVLSFEEDDYRASKNRELKYAQSYTLVYYLLYGEGGDQRDLFMEFMRSAYLGRSSMTDLQDILEIESKDKFEERWFAAIDEIAERV